MSGGCVATLTGVHTSSNFFVFMYFDLHVQLMLSLVHNYIASKVSVTGKRIFFTGETVSLTLNFLTIWLIECWLMLVTQQQNRNRVYSRVTLMLMMLRWHQCHIVNHALVWIMCMAWICSLIGWYSWSTQAYTLVFEISTRLVVFFVVYRLNCLVGRQSVVDMQIQLWWTRRLISKMNWCQRRKSL